MARLRNPATGSLVNVPDERAAAYTARGYTAVETTPAGETPAKGGRKKAADSAESSDK